MIRWNNGNNLFAVIAKNFCVAIKPPFFNLVIAFLWRHCNRYQTIQPTCWQNYPHNSFFGDVWSYHVILCSHSTSHHILLFHYLSAKFFLSAKFNFMWLPASRSPPFAAIVRQRVLGVPNVSMSSARADVWIISRAFGLRICSKWCVDCPFVCENIVVWIIWRLMPNAAYFNELKW